MDHQPGTGSPPVYHGGDGRATSEREGRPRLFALLDYIDDESDETEVAHYGVQFPDGAAATVAPAGGSYGRWSSPARAADRLGLELSWLD